MVLCFNLLCQYVSQKSKWAYIILCTKNNWYLATLIGAIWKLNGSPVLTMVYSLLTFGIMYAICWPKSTKLNEVYIAKCVHYDYLLYMPVCCVPHGWWANDCIFCHCVPFYTYRLAYIRLGRVLAYLRHWHEVEFLTHVLSYCRSPYNMPRVTFMFSSSNEYTHTKVVSLYTPQDMRHQTCSVREKLLYDITASISLQHKLLLNYRQHCAQRKSAGI